MRKVKRERRWLLALFGLPFFAVGVGFLVFSVLPTLNDGWRMESWPTTQGTLSHAKLNSSTSDGSTTYSVEARYRYRVNGIEYSHDRVAINSGGDNIGDFQQQLGSRLEHLHRNNLPVTVYYNPNDPADALLDRSIRWPLLGFKLIFVLIFGGAGLGLMVYALRGKKVIDIPEAVDKPWLRRAEWVDNHILSNARGGVWMLWVFAIFWNLISTPGAFMFNEVRQEEGAVAYLILLFPAIGLMLLVWAIKKTMEWRRFGVTPLRMDPFPGAIGGDVAGEVTLNIPFDPQMVCEMSLSCIHSYVSGSGKNRSRHERVKWQDSGYAKVERAAKGGHLLFRFEVPEGLNESEEHSDNYYLWRLHLKSELPGVDLGRDFEIPVYRTGERSRTITLKSAEERPVGMAKLTVESLLPLQRNGMTQELYYPMLRRPMRALGGVLFGSLFAGIGVFLWGEALRSGAMLYLMSAVFSLVGWGIVMAGIYSALNALRVQLDGRKVSVVRSLLGIPLTSRHAAYSEVRSVELKHGGTSTQQGSRHTVEYQVIATTGREKLVLAEQIDSHSKAKLVVEFFKKQLKFPEKSVGTDQDVVLSFDDD